jgi:hypothetical protein
MPVALIVGLVLAGAAVAQPETQPEPPRSELREAAAAEGDQTRSTGATEDAEEAAADKDDQTDSSGVTKGAEQVDKPPDMKLFWAVFWLLFGIMLSFVGEKWMDVRRRRHAFMERIARLRPLWLRGEPPLPLVVWVKAVLRQAESLSGLGWLPGSGLIEERVVHVERLLPILAKARRIRRAFESSPLPTIPHLVRFRAKATLRTIISSIGLQALDEGSAERVSTELDELRAWLNPGELPLRYWKSVRRSIDKLLVEVRPYAFPEADRDLIRQVISGIEQDRSKFFEMPPNHISAELLQLVERYAALKLLWERLQYPEYEELMACLKAERAIQAYFEVADQAAWKRIREASSVGNLQIERPPLTAVAFETFRPIRLGVTTGSHTLDKTHLFNYEVDWKWKITIMPDDDGWLRRHLGRRARREPVVLEPRSTEREIMQFAPRAGKLTASVTVVFDRAPVDQQKVEIALGEPFRIERSTDFSRRKALAVTELVAAGIAVVVALVAGLSTEYLDKPEFGETRDYIHLFLWGVATDRVKSFLAKTGVNGGVPKQSG